MDIVLDKTVNETRKVLLNKPNKLDHITLHQELGILNEFNFNGSNVKLPIRNVGLGTECFKRATDSFMVTVVKKDGTYEKVFEPLVGTDMKISDFVRDIDPKALNWYFKTASMPADYSQYGNNEPLFEPNFESTTINIMPDMGNYKEGRDIDRGGADLRKMTVSEAYNEAVKMYKDLAIENNAMSEKELETFIEQDAKAFEENMSELEIFRFPPEFTCVK